MIRYRMILASFSRIQRSNHADGCSRLSLSLHPVISSALAPRNTNRFLRSCSVVTPSTVEDDLLLLLLRCATVVEEAERGTSRTGP
jgi:hypothetical protein